MADHAELAAPILRKVLSLYAGERWVTRFHVASRCRIIPFDKLEELMPRSGTIADLGCGHGAFSNLLALTSPQREVMGIDRDRKKIEIAARTIGKKRNITFKVGDLSQFRLGTFSGIAILGVLYLLPYDRHRPLLEQCVQSLLPGGVLLLTTIDPSRRIRFWESKLLEFTANLTLRLIGAQSTSVSPRLHPRRKEEWAEMLRAIGFSVQMLNIHLPVPENILLCCKK